MKLILLSLFLSSSAAGPILAQDDAPRAKQELVMLHLADGSTLWGELTGHDATEISFKRLDTGGEVKVPWTRLDTAQSDALRENLGYIDHSGDELTIEADRLILDDGSEVVGKIINRTDAMIVVKTATLVVQVPKLRVRGSAGTEQVPALEVYTRDELFQQELANLVVDSASSQFELARFCERILDFSHALEHYQKAAELDPNFKRDEVKQLIARAKVRTANQAQLDYLFKVDLLRLRKKFDEADKAVDAFATLYPSSSLQSDADKKKKQIAKARDQALRADVVSLWNFHAGRLAEKAVRDPKSTLEQAIQYAGEKMSDDILAAVTADLQRRVSKTVEAEQVRKMWTERKNAPAQKATYGIGTWLLGDDARKELDAAKNGETKKPEQTEKDKDRAKLEDKIKRYLQNQAMVKKTKENADKEGENSKFWESWLVSGRKQWLLAYFVEHSKDYAVNKVLFSNCPECNGLGVREILNSGSAVSSPKGTRGGKGPGSSGLAMVDCPTCHHVGIRRQVSYR